MTKYIATAVIALVLAGGVYGGYKFLLTPQITPPVGATTPQGNTGQTGKQASIFGVNLANPGANATSSSYLNNSTVDWYVTGVKALCEGVGTSKTAYTGTGLASLTVAIATSSTAAPATNSNTNYPGGALMTIATSSTLFGISSSTVAVPGNGLPGIIWASGTYLTFTTNATNTAICTFGADYTSS